MKEVRQVYVYDEEGKPYLAYTTGIELDKESRKSYKVGLPEVLVTIPHRRGFVPQMVFGRKIKSMYSGYKQAGYQFVTFTRENWEVLKKVMDKAFEDAEKIVVI